MSIPLRPYQTAAVRRCNELVAAGVRRLLLVLPTGGGKTVVAAHIVEHLVGHRRRVLFVAHRRELINQTVDKLARMGVPETLIGVVMAGDRRRNPIAPVQVASVDTLRNRQKPPADLVIVDEAHRALAKSYVDICAAYPSAIHLGLTATPYRADGKGLASAYEELVVVATPAELIADGHLVEPRVWTVPAEDLPNLVGIKVKGGDYDEKALAVAVDQGGLVGNIVEHWQRHAEGRRTVAFACSVEHSRHIASRFVEAGIAAEHLDGETPAPIRDAILARLESGETLVVSNCGVLCEGWDQPAVKCCILARPTKSPGLYLQQAGRILRPWRGVDAVILDHSGDVLEHGLPQMDREFTLEDRPKKKSAAAAPAKTCSSCFAIVPVSARFCPGCGALFEVSTPPEVPEEREATLVEVRVADMAEKKAEWDRLVETAQRRGYASGWPWHRYKEKFGVPPPSAFQAARPARPDAPEAEKLREFNRLLGLARERGYRQGWVWKTYAAKFGGEPPMAWLVAEAVPA